MSVETGAVARPLPAGVRVRTTLSRGRLRAPYRLLGQRRALYLHDRIVARRVPAMADEIDVVHAWPSGALETLQRAKELGIPSVLERPNAHTRVAFEIVRGESERLGVPLPPGSEHAFDAEVLAREEREFELADRLLCPSEFVRGTFLDQGFDEQKLLLHSYGFDPAVFHPASASPDTRPFTALFAGVAAVRKGLHYALEAWLDSSAHRDGVFLVAGTILPAYRDKLSSMLSHSSVRVLGHRNDVPELMRRSDVFVLPTLEEGSPLAALEALGSGCVPLVSDVCLGPCQHMINALVHPVRDVGTLAAHMTLVHSDPSLLAELRTRAIRESDAFTWTAAGKTLLGAYAAVLEGRGVDSELTTPAKVE
jgi:glycosyltransferase involved in cell wall biosynthesis